jgi:hypothetical protein
MMRASHLDEEEAETSPMIISIFLDDDETEQESLWIESATDSGNHTAAAGKEIALASAEVSASESNSNPASLNKFKVYLLAICMALYALGVSHAAIDALVCRPIQSDHLRATRRAIFD